MVQQSRRRDMVTPENMMSVDGQHALQDMVELEMYLLAQAQQRPWPMVPRGRKAPPIVREPFCNPVESSVVNELAKLGFIEATSSRTFVVSRSGYDFYDRDMKPHSS